METRLPYEHRTKPGARPGALGKLAHLLVPLQGHAMHDIAHDADADRALGSQAIVNAEADRLRDRLADLLTVATALAKRERAYETHARLVATIAIVGRLAELDDAQDTHRELARADVQQSAAFGRQIVGGIDHLICGAARSPSAPPMTEPLAVLPCRRAAGHASVHVFEVVALVEEDAHGTR